MPNKKSTSLRGKLSVLSADRESFTEVQIQLLAAVDELMSEEWPEGVKVH